MWSANGEEILFHGTVNASQSKYRVYSLRPGEAPKELLIGQDAMYARLSGVEGVAEVRYNPLEVDLAQALGNVGRRILLPLAAVLTLLIGLVVGNTVRLSLLRRREEMEILRLVGATEWYIRRPMPKAPQQIK